MDHSDGGYGRFTRLTLIVAAIALATVTLAAAIYHGANVFLFTFAGIVLGAGLHGLASWLRQKTGWRPAWSLAAVTGAIALLLVLTGWLLGAQISKQLDEMTTALPEATAAIRDKLDDSALGKRLLGLGQVQMNGGGGGGGALNGGFFQQITGYFSLGLSAIGYVVLVIFLGIYFAAGPGMYRCGVLHLIPKRGRPRAGEILDLRPRPRRV